MVLGVVSKRMEAMEGVMKDQKPMREGGTWLLVQRRLKGMCSTKGGELGVQGEVHKEVKSNQGGPKFVVMFGNEVEATHKGDSERWSVLGIDMINSMRYLPTSFCNIATLNILSLSFISFYNSLNPLHLQHKSIMFKSHPNTFLLFLIHPS